MDKKHNMTTLMLAALNGHKELVVELVEKWHGDINAETAYGQTAKMMAENNNHEAIVKYFEKRGAMKTILPF